MPQVMGYIRQVDKTVFNSNWSSKNLQQKNSQNIEEIKNKRKERVKIRGIYVSTWLQ